MKPISHEIEYEGSLLFVRFNYKLGYKPCDLLQIRVLLLVEITAFRLERIFQPIRALEFITCHMVYNLTNSAMQNCLPDLYKEFTIDSFKYMIAVKKVFFPQLFRHKFSGNLTQ